VPHAGNFPKTAILPMNYTFIRGSKMTATTTRTPAISTDIFGTTLTLNFSNGMELAIDVTTLTPEMLHQAALHGLKQKLCDGAAIARDTVTGGTATIADKFSAVLTIYNRITKENAWNANREGVEKASGGVFVRAMMELTGKTKVDMDAILEKYTKEQLAALKKNPRVLEITQRMERERALATDTTSDNLLAELGL
jgi:hypothetical protein